VGWREDRKKEENHLGAIGRVYMRSDSGLGEGCDMDGAQAIWEIHQDGMPGWIQNVPDSSKHPIM
jgi:hypothetical protein